MNVDLSPTKKMILLGVPIDHLSLEEGEKRIFALLEEAKEKKHSYYISTVNTDFLVNVQGWSWSAPRHPELLQILRQSQINTADGMPLVWLSYLLGCPLKGRVTGADLVPVILHSCSLLKKSVYFLGGEDSLLPDLEAFIKKTYPELIIAGMEAPTISVTGEELEHAAYYERPFVEKIQQSQPDVLLIALGNPKQEIWFQRIRYQAHVPISLGVGGGMNLFLGIIPRAPAWMQSWGLEWLYRLYKEPKRLWKRYLRDAFNFLFLSIPLLLVHFALKMFLWIRHYFGRASSFPLKRLEVAFGQGKMTVITFPCAMTKMDEELLSHYLTLSEESDGIILDFKDASFLSSSTLGLLVSAMTAYQRVGKRFIFFGIGRVLKCLLKRHRIFDLFEKNMFSQLKLAIPFWEEEESHFAFAIEKEPEKVNLIFFGDIDAKEDLRGAFASISQQLLGFHCHINMRYCSFIDSSGVGFLLKLKRFQIEQNKRLFLENLSPTLQQILKVARVDTLFIINREDSDYV